MPGPRAAVFIDRDGVICENRPDYVKSWAEFSFIPGGVEALASLSNAGCRLYVITNQSVVGRGLISRRQLDVIHEKMLDVLAGAGAHIDAVLVCPHHPDDGCSCRKPKPGLLTDAAMRFKITLAESVVVGDHRDDVETGSAAGCETVLVRTGRGAETEAERRWGTTRPTFIADDLVDAAIWILGRQAMRVTGSTGLRARR